MLNKDFGERCKFEVEVEKDTGSGANEGRVWTMWLRRWDG